MIIACPNCNKKFKIDPTLIPEDGRDLKCGSCNHVWLYKVEVVELNSFSTKMTMLIIMRLNLMILKRKKILNSKRINLYPKK